MKLMIVPDCSKAIATEVAPLQDVYAPPKESGFTLLEVLVALVVLSLGLLGVYGLQLTSLKNNDSAYLRSQATLYAYEIIDRLRANREAALAGAYNKTLSAFSSLTVPGSGASIAEIDRYEWYQNLETTLPSAQGAIDCNASAICTATVQWDDVRAEGSTALKQQVVAAQL